MMRDVIEVDSERWAEAEMWKGRWHRWEWQQRKKRRQMIQRQKEERREFCVSEEIEDVVQTWLEEML